MAIRLGRLVSLTKVLKVGAGGIFLIPFVKMEETLNIKIGVQLGVYMNVEDNVPNPPFSRIIC